MHSKDITAEVLSRVKNGATCMDKSFYETLIKVPNLKIQSSGHDTLWSAYDMGQNFAVEDSLDRTLMEISMRIYMEGDVL